MEVRAVIWPLDLFWGSMSSFNPISLGAVGRCLYHHDSRLFTSILRQVAHQRWPIIHRDCLWQPVHQKNLSIRVLNRVHVSKFGTRTAMRYLSILESMCMLYTHPLYSHEVNGLTVSRWLIGIGILVAHGAVLLFLAGGVVLFYCMHGTQFFITNMTTSFIPWKYALVCNFSKVNLHVHVLPTLLHRAGSTVPWWDWMAFI